MGQVADTSAEARFNRLRSEWEERTQFSSSVNEMAMDPAYQQIIGMGDEGLPYVLKALRDNPSHWFWALSAITGEDQAAGVETFSEARQKWLTWGIREGHLV